ncbi:cytochrome P450 [Pleomassaria siparia CBS 279.74]|uniref:Cytochrome P450 n=1 Tax=Pleomassaria siparia CBS 279.74 TaxID=1314801 RepID=A0A6G1K7R7_9PLEO|nr:cytochrome P450 [Pleomassaria siparia CBS 279.74]
MFLVIFDRFITIEKFDGADEFRVEGWLSGRFEKPPRNAFNPSDDGERACIGRGFAEQEMIIILSLILQKFQVEAADPNYSMSPAVSLTLKPGGFKIMVRRRPGRDLSSLGGALSKAGSKQHDNTSHEAVAANGQEKKLITGVEYTVFGVRNSDWGLAFHHDWMQSTWNDVRKCSGTTTDVAGGGFKAEVTAPKLATHLGGSNIGYDIVKVNEDLGGSDVGLSKKHM